MQCHIDNDTKSRGTAKIYDPVYSSDVVFAHICANKHINNEAEADTRIREAGISGKVTPVFLGAWVMEVPVPSKDFGGAGYATTRSAPGSRCFYSETSRQQTLRVRICNTTTPAAMWSLNRKSLRLGEERS
jgi:hypothetical protein